MHDQAQRDEVIRRGEELYERLRPSLEPAHNGDAIAIHVESGDYEIDRSWALASRRVRQRHREGGVYTLFIGPPTHDEFTLSRHSQGVGKR